MMSTTYEDILHGYLVLFFTILTSCGLVFLKQILQNDVPDWFEIDEPNNQQQLNVLFPPIPGENHIEEVR